MKRTEAISDFGTEKIGRILLRMAPPVMLGQLIQAMYNIVDSFFIGRYSGDGLTALSIIFPVQLIISAVGAGIGVGINTLISRYDGLGNSRRAESVARAGTGMAVLHWALVVLLVFLFLKPYILISSASPEVRRATSIYGNIVCYASLPHLLDYTWTKTLQARGNMKTTMLAQLIGSCLNIALDPLLIWGFWKIPAMGIAGAAIATVAGQTAAALVSCSRGFYGVPTLKDMRENTGLIYKTAIPSLVLQFMYTLYISGLNLILGAFSDAAVTVLGLYYKLHSFFGIPIFGLQSCALPLLSYNYAAGNMERCKTILRSAMGIAAALMCVCMLAMELFPRQLLGIFSDSADILDLGGTALRLIATGYPFSVVSLMMPFVFQALGRNGRSLAVIILRHVVLFVPVAWLLSRFGLNFVWLTFPITEAVTAAVALLLSRGTLKARVGITLEDGAH